jgi:hypothetical protein
VFNQAGGLGGGFCQDGQDFCDCGEGKMVKK